MSTVSKFIYFLWGGCNVCHLSKDDVFRNGLSFCLFLYLYYFPFICMCTVSEFQLEIMELPKFVFMFVDVLIYSCDHLVVTSDTEKNKREKRKKQRDRNSY